MRNKRLFHVLSELVKHPLIFQDRPELDKEIAEMDMLLQVSSQKITKKLAHKKVKNGKVVYKKTSLAETLYNKMKKKRG